MNRNPESWQIDYDNGFSSWSQMSNRLRLISFFTSGMLPLSRVWTSQSRLARTSSPVTTIPLEARTWSLYVNVVLTRIEKTCRTSSVSCPESSRTRKNSFSISSASKIIPFPPWPASKSVQKIDRMLLPHHSENNTLEAASFPGDNWGICSRPLFWSKARRCSCIFPYSFPDYNPCRSPLWWYHFSPKPAILIHNSKRTNSKSLPVSANSRFGVAWIRVPAEWNTGDRKIPQRFSVTVHGFKSSGVQGLPASGGLNEELNRLFYQIKTLV